LKKGTAQSAKFATFLIFFAFSPRFAMQIVRAGAHRLICLANHGSVPGSVVGLAVQNSCLSFSLLASLLTWYNLYHETRIKPSICRRSGYKRSPGSGTALRLAACQGVRLTLVLQVPDLVQVRDFLLSMLFQRCPKGWAKAFFATEATEFSEKNSKAL
jgi:hypothetical protein